MSILFYLFYRSLIVDETYNGAFYNKYYVFTSILILTSLISYFFSNKLKMNIFDYVLN